MYILDGLGIHLGCDSVWFNEENGVLHCYFYSFYKAVYFEIKSPKSDQSDHTPESSSDGEKAL